MKFLAIMFYVGLAGCSYGLTESKSATGETRFEAVCTTDMAECDEQVNKACKGFYKTITRTEVETYVGPVKKGFKGELLVECVR